MSFRLGAFLWRAALCALSCLSLSACEDRAQLNQDVEMRAAIFDYMGEANCRKAHREQGYKMYRQCLETLERQERQNAENDGW